MVNKKKPKTESKMDKISEEETTPKNRKQRTKRIEENTEQPIMRGEHEEFKNLNIKPSASNASDSEDESQQRIFQFSPLSSNKNKIDGDEGSSSKNGSGGENTSSVPTNLLEMRLRDSSSNQHSPSMNHLVGTNSEPYNDLVQVLNHNQSDGINEHDSTSMANNRHSIID